VRHQQGQLVDLDVDENPAGLGGMRGDLVALLEDERLSVPRTSSVSCDLR
jgi:hypothetical protein